MNHFFKRYKTADSLNSSVSAASLTNGDYDRFTISMDNENNADNLKMAAKTDILGDRMETAIHGVESTCMEARIIAAAAGEEALRDGAAGTGVESAGDAADTGIASVGVAAGTGSENESVTAGARSESVSVAAGTGKEAVNAADTDMEAGMDITARWRVEALSTAAGTADIRTDTVSGSDVGTGGDMAVMSSDINISQLMNNDNNLTRLISDADINNRSENVKIETRSNGMFASISGIVESINHFYNENNEIVGNNYLMNVVTNGKTVTFFLSPETYFADCNIQAGDTVVGYYHTEQPMPFIYPPRFNIRVLARVSEGRNTKTDFFNHELVSSDGMLRLNITNETFIMNENGRPYCRRITNNNLFVIYGASTRSIPAITVPSLVVVLSH